MLNLTFAVDRETIATATADRGILEEKRRNRIDIGLGRYSELQYCYRY